MLEIIGVRTQLIEPNDNLTEIFLNALEDQDLELKNNDIIVIASSAISTVTSRIRKIEEIVPSEKAKKLAQKCDLEEKYLEIILQESDKILNPFKDCILTLKDDMLRINAGVDRTNVPAGYALLLPKNSEKIASKIKTDIEKETGKKIGVIISDSHVHPLRRGTTGQALGTSGINEAIDCRTQKDLYGRKLQITFRGIGDQLATAAQLVMGEADESIPIVIIRGADVAFSEKEGESLKIPPEECVYSRYFDYESEEI
ncbi:hypothetical protein AKJ49_00930 [candidate division MSBL1 archaeon SCGC-AAA382A03]|uniref:Coenzyme F420:L-glutamate ligase-like domain-containing protein n=1 Tax=candidate division MSBL1 archaeon SCGC-AAA382A03 TaxID=1698278 RepID=A0A133VG05_9EURY|nr:hypothetical protein AKJ49_00930 [candidate division MSBL1 archaeon SCGC-AAA382A03]